MYRNTVPLLNVSTYVYLYAYQFGMHNGMFSGTPLNSLTTVGYLLDVFIKLWIPSMVRIFTSAWS